MKDLKVHGMACLFAKGDNIVWSNSYGSAKENSIFRVASISKTVISTALMQLFEKGMFKLEDDVSNYLGLKVRNPKFPEVPINFIHLFTHTSGLTEAFDDYFYDNLSNPKLQYLKQLVCEDGDFCPTNLWSSYAPGGKFEYSNVGYTVLGCLLEKISGMPFNDYCIENIFKPLGMDASFDVTKLKHIENLSKIYRYNEDTNSHIISYDNYSLVSSKPFDNTIPLGNCIKNSPAGGLRTSLSDLAKYMIAHMNKGEYKGLSILKPDTVELMHSIHWKGNNKRGFYKTKGLGFHVTDDLYPGLVMTGHSGDAYGILSGMYFNSDLKVGIIFVENGGLQSHGMKSPFPLIEELCYNRILNEFLAI